MQKRLIITLVIVAISIIGIITYRYYSKEIQQINTNELYEKVEQYLINLEKPLYFSKSKEEERNYNIRDFKVFTDIAQLGTTKKGKETNVYVWALIESYFVQDGEMIQNSGSSIPYKFIFENNEIIDYKQPRDGAEYTKSIEEIFPDNIRRKLKDELVDSKKIDNEVLSYYSYLKKK